MGLGSIFLTPLNSKKIVESFVRHASFTSKTARRSGGLAWSFFTVSVLITMYRMLKLLWSLVILGSVPRGAAGENSEKYVQRIYCSMFSYNVLVCFDTLKNYGNLSNFFLERNGIT